MCSYLKQANKLKQLEEMEERCCNLFLSVLSVLRKLETHFPLSAWHGSGNCQQELQIQRKTMYLGQRETVTMDKPTSNRACAF